MNLQRISCKIYAEDPGAIGATASEYIPIFHRWIQAGELTGLPIDVADYGHVPHGPGVMLIGHEADRAMDLSEGRPGFLYARKRDATGSTSRRIAQVVAEAAAGAERLEAEPALEQAVNFSTREIRITIADRLNAPNNDATLEHISGDIIGAIQQVFPGVELQLAREGDARRPFTVRASMS